MEADLQTQTVSLTKKDSELAQTKERVRVLVKETQEKSDRLESLEGEIQELLCLKQVLFTRMVISCLGMTSAIKD